MTIIEGAENIERFQLIRMRKAGVGDRLMKLSHGSVLAAFQRQFGIKSRTKAVGYR